MATRTSLKVAAGIQPKGLRVGLVAVTAFFSAVSLSTGDIIQMVKVPQNATPVYVGVSGGIGSVSFTVGDGVSDSRYISVLSGSVGMGLTTINTPYVPYTYSTDDTLDIFVSVNSATTAAGAFNMIAIFSMDT